MFRAKSVLMNTAKKGRTSKKRIIISVGIFDFKTCCFRMSRNPVIQTISIIDDNCGLLASLSMRLESCGYRTVKFSCSQKALDFHLMNPADFYFIDVKFPQISGVELYESLCKHSKVERIPAIFISAANQLEAKCLEETTIGDFVQKPFSFDALMARMNRVIKLHERL